MVDILTGDHAGFAHRPVASPRRQEERRSEAAERPAGAARGAGGPRGATQGEFGAPTAGAPGSRGATGRPHGGARTSRSISTHDRRVFWFPGGGPANAPCVRHIVLPLIAQLRRRAFDAWNAPCIAAWDRPSPSCRRKGRSLSLAALIERPRCVGVLEPVEHVDRLLIAVGLGEFGIKQNAAVSLLALARLGVPDLTWNASCAVALVEGAIRPCAASATSGSAARAACGCAAGTACSARGCAAGASSRPHTRLRGERQAEDENSTQ